MFPILPPYILEHLSHKIAKSVVLPIGEGERARHPEYVSPWERAIRRPKLVDVAQSGTITVARLEQIDPGYIARALAAWDDGRRRDAIVMLRDGFINGGEEAPDGRFHLVFALMFDGQTEEAYRWALTGTDSDANELMVATCATLLAERGERIPELMGFTRGLYASGYDAEEEVSYLPATSNSSYARITAWSALARLFAGSGMWRWEQLANQRVLALDPGSPVAAERYATYTLSKATTPETKRELAAMLKLALSRAVKPGYRALDLWALLYRADMDAARAIPRPRTHD